MSSKDEPEDIRDLIDRLEKQAEPESWSYEGRARLAGFLEENLEDPFNDIKGYIAPGIMGQDDVKRALGIQMFSPGKPFHILVIGDPASAKTDLLLQSASINPNANYAAGSGTSGRGLTASLEKGKLKPGVLALSNGSCTYLDELLFLPSNEITAIYTSMEHGFIPYNKAGVNITLPARTALAMGTNPRGESWDREDSESMKKQIPFKTSLMTRIHLPLLLPPYTSEEFDEIVGKQIRGWFGFEKGLDEYEKEMLANYISFGKSISVRKPQELYQVAKLVKGYVSVLKREEARGKIILPVSPRSSKGVMHIAEAIARMELRQEVSEADIKRAIALSAKAYEKAGLESSKLEKEGLDIEGFEGQQPLSQWSLER